MITFLKYISVTRWVLRLQLFRTKHFYLNLVISPLILCGPIVFIGYLLGRRHGIDLFTPGIKFSLVWIALAPFLIQWAFKTVVNFLSECQGVFEDKVDRARIREQEIKRFQSWRHWLFGVPWGLVAATVLHYTLFRNAPSAIQTWLFLWYFLIFFVSAIGFWGIYVIMTMIGKVLRENVRFDPHHPDRFGGISCLGRFTVKGALFFSSGVLFFPLVLEVIEGLESGTGFIKVIVFCCVGLFISVMMLSFLLPLIQIKAFADKKKERIALESRSTLEDMMAEFRSSDKLNTKLALDLFMYYHLTYPRLSELRNYPVDFRVFLELAASFAAPIFVAALQAFL